MRQRSAALLFGTVGPTEQRTAVGTAPTDLQPQAHPASEGQDRALLPIAGPERATTAGALASMRDQRSRQVGCGLRALFTKQAPPGWLTMWAAMKALGVSRQTELQRFKPVQLRPLHD